MIHRAKILAGLTESSEMPAMTMNQLERFCDRYLEKIKEELEQLEQIPDTGWEIGHDEDYERMRTLKSSAISDAIERYIDARENLIASYVDLIKLMESIHD